VKGKLNVRALPANDCPMLAPSTGAAIHEQTDMNVNIKNPSKTVQIVNP
jgi:tRNA(Ser,Leu) C12 N-acetylase TAN1